MIAGVTAHLETRLQEKDALLTALVEGVRSLPPLIREWQTVPTALDIPIAVETALTNQLVVDKLDAIKAAITQEATPVVEEEPTHTPDWSNEQSIDRLAAFLEQF